MQIVPLILQGAVIGLLQAVHSQPSALGLDDLQLLEAAANWASIAIGNARQYDQLRHLAHKSLSAQEEERKRIALILHDHVQQILYGVQMRAHLFQVDLSPESAVRVQENLTELQRLIEEAITATRGLAHELTPPILETSEVTVMLKWLADHMQTLHGLNTTVTVQNGLQIEDKNSRILLFHTVRELLFNVVKHAGILEVEVTATKKDGVVQVSVYDEGHGFDLVGLSSNNTKSGMGLSSIRERLQLFGGEIYIDSAPEQGTRATILLPPVKAKQFEFSQTV